MAHEHKLEIFRGLLKFKSNTQKIWGVLIFLTIVTAIEVVLGIYKPDILMHTWLSPFEGGFFATLGNIILSPFIYMKPLNLIFILLTIVKAYYITWDFMHMRDEKPSLRRAVVWTGVFLICYLIFILLQEGGYVFEVYNTKDALIKRDF
ncbi:MAG: cytochrome C oxidase subunit IV family protein [Winogradskyella sp.]|uniref:cytochrome C oxidase subunit IV family protein n=1 Tax=Winogradskyella sp. TaxID=1883156 RepID=UPI001833E030|nr:cytochrome C oxidase subunit IV family protein [Winogradskyella sp.]MBT8244992.1 cytochrome C oxidase subunit IV family protein [Winogradskyella sp.]NNK22166.1 cytochrome C oxidase subunit IV family protein [Winogradskyella sp.]